DPDSAAKREDLAKKIAAAKSKAEEMRGKWHKETETLRMIREAKEDLERARNAQKDAERQGDLTKAAEVKFGKIPVLERTIELAEQSLKEASKDGSILRGDAVRPEDIAIVISSSTGVPVTKMLEGERQKLVNMEQRLGMRVIGQDHAVKAISDAVRL